MKVGDIHYQLKHENSNQQDTQYVKALHISAVENIVLVKCTHDGIKIYRYRNQ